VPAAVLIALPGGGKVDNEDNEDDDLDKRGIEQGSKKVRDEAYTVTTAAAVVAKPFAPSPPSLLPFAATNSSVSEAEKYPTVELSDLKLERVLGGGAFGQVWKGEWRGTPVVSQAHIFIHLKLAFALL
jgi:hypothetical protein